MEHIKTIVIGGGQAGLSASYYLQQEREEHLVLDEAAKPANRWRNERWDSFTHVTPRSVFNIPGADYKGNEPDSFMPRSELIQFFEDYIDNNGLPVKYNSHVKSVEQYGNKGYYLDTNDRKYFADNVIVATGFFQKPKMLNYDIPKNINVIESGKYRNPDSLPLGAVLVVGSGQSGCQIAEELCLHGRKVFLSTGKAGRVPRRYRGKDIIVLLDMAGFYDKTADQLPPGVSKYDGIPHLSGAKGGHTLNLHQFFRDGITLLGHIKGIDDGKVFIQPDLYDNLNFADQTELKVTNYLDSFISSKGLNLPEEKIPQLKDGFDQPLIEKLDLEENNINTIILAIGYRFDFSLVKIRCTDNDGCPITDKGVVNNYPGLYYAGLRWSPSERPGNLLGVGDSVKYIVNHIIERKHQISHQII